MRGRSQATLVVTACAILSLIVPIVGLISSAGVALMTLRQGPSEGLLLIGLSGLASALLTVAILGSPLAAVGFVLLLWLPIWLLALALRQSRSLDLTVLLAAALGLLIVTGFHLQATDPALYWAEVLEPVRAQLVENQVIDAAAGEQLVVQVARWMTGVFATAFYLQLLLALFIGRQWQALLYNPGGFDAEFRALRVRVEVGYFALVLLVLLLLFDGVLWVAELLILSTPLFFLQGVAVAHELVRARAVGRGWLFWFYVMLILLLLVMPAAVLLVVILGFLDIWADFRRWPANRGPKE